MPIVYILAGPNGTGKTTFYFTAIQDGAIDPALPFLNIDLIAQSLGGYTAENYARAPEIYRSIVKQHLATGADFMIESNLATSGDYDWIAAMRKQGYDVVLYYLSTDDVEINIGRVKRRVAEGGHDIPEAIVRSRYLQSHAYLKTKLTEFKEAYLIDNSTESFQNSASLQWGKIVFLASDAPKWILDALSFVQRIQGKLK